MPETITVIAEKMGSLTLEGGIGVRIVQVDGGGLRLFFDRPFMYCGDAVVFEGGEEEAEDGEQSGVSPITRAWRKNGPPGQTSASRRGRISSVSVPGNIFTGPKK